MATRHKQDMFPEEPRPNCIVLLQIPKLRSTGLGHASHQNPNAAIATLHSCPSRSSLHKNSMCHQTYLSLCMASF